MRASIHELSIAKPKPNKATASTESAAIEPPQPRGASVPIKTPAIRICVGQRPLQREKLFVKIAINRSRGESMIRVATTPAALQPKPIAIVSACLPCAPTR